MAKPLVSDELWQRIEPLCLNPSLVASGSPGQGLDYRKVLTGIIFVLKTGIPWEQLPQEMGCGCGMTCLNYLNAWQRAGSGRIAPDPLGRARAGRQARLVPRRGR